MKTFVTENMLSLMKSSIDKSAAIVQRITDSINEALDELRNLFKVAGVESIDVANYEEDYAIAVEDDYENVTLVPVSRVEIWEGYLYVVDKDGNDHEEREWGAKAPELLTVATKCLNEKLTGIQKLAVGTKVRWIDPGIEDYEPEDREEVLNRIFEVTVCPDEIEQDSVIVIDEVGGGSEAEVNPLELVLVD